MHKGIFVAVIVLFFLIPIDVVFSNTSANGDYKYKTVNTYLEFDGKNDYAVIDSENLKEVHNSGEVTYGITFYVDDPTKDFTLIHRGATTGKDADEGINGCIYEPRMNTIYSKLSGCDHTGEISEYNPIKGWNQLIVSMSKTKDEYFAHLNESLINEGSLNDLKENSSLEKSILNTSFNKVFLGAENPNKNTPPRPKFKGKISGLAIWDKALSEGEIEQADMKELTGEEDNLAALYNFEDIDDDTFYDLTENEINGEIHGAIKGETITITGYKGSDKKLIIPDTINGKEVVGIDNGVFENKNLTYVSIPDTVETISNNAFKGNSNLSEVYIYNPNTEFGEGVFLKASNDLVLFGKEGSSTQVTEFENNTIFQPLDHFKYEPNESSLYFDGKTEVNIGDLTNPIEDWTYETWMIAEKGAMSATFGDEQLQPYLRNGGKISVSYRGDGKKFYPEKSSKILEGGWDHIAITKQGNEIKIFLNGEYYAGTEREWEPLEGYMGIGYGYWSGSYPTKRYYFKGKIKETRLWKRALSKQNINENMNKDLKGDEKGLFGYWKINEGSGDEIFDYSKNENHGALIGGEWIPEALTITNYTGEKKNIIIPSELDRATVTKIGSAAFQGKGLTSVKLPNTLEVIEDSVGENTGAFQGNNLESVVIPGNVSNLGKRAFEENYELKKVIVYNKNIKYGEDVFSNTDEGITLYSYSDSTTKNYATSNNHRFVDFGASRDKTIVANIEGSPLILDVTSHLKNNKEIPIDSSKELIFDEIGSLEYTITDNRGVEDEYDVKLSMTDFTLEGEGSTELLKMDSVNFENDKDDFDLIDLSPSDIKKGASIYQGIPRNERHIKGSIKLKEITFSNDDFIQSGTYSSTLTLEFVTDPGG